MHRRIITERIVILNDHKLYISFGNIHSINTYYEANTGQTHQSCQGERQKSPLNHRVGPVWNTTVTVTMLAENLLLVQQAAPMNLIPFIIRRKTKLLMKQAFQIQTNHCPYKQMLMVHFKQQLGKKVQPNNNSHMFNTLAIFVIYFYVNFQGIKVLFLAIVFLFLKEPQQKIQSRLTKEMSFSK